MTNSLISELAALEQSTDPEKREVGARLRTAIRNVLLGLEGQAVLREYMEKFPMPEYYSDVSVDTDWECVGDIEGGGKIFMKPGQRRQWERR